MLSLGKDSNDSRINSSGGPDAARGPRVWDPWYWTFPVSFVTQNFHRPSKTVVLNQNVSRSTCWVTLINVNQRFSTGVPWAPSKCAANFFVLTFTTLLWKVRKWDFVCDLKNKAIFQGLFLNVKGICVQPIFFLWLVCCKLKKVENHWSIQRSFLEVF